MPEADDQPAYAPQRPRRGLRHLVYAVLLLLLLAGGLWRRGQLAAPSTVAVPGASPGTSAEAQPAQLTIADETAPDGAVHRKYTLWTDGIMGTYAQATFWDVDEARARNLGMLVFGVFRACDAQFSNYKPDSEMTQLNLAAPLGPVACSDEMWEMLTAARRIYVLSDGAYDLSVGPLMRLWGFHRKRQTTPTGEEVAETLAVVGLRRVLFDDATHRVRFTRDGIGLDSGGIAKGYALDLATRALAQAGVRQGLLDLGGNVRCLAEPPPGRQTYRVGIRHPRQRDRAVTHVEVRDRAISTSGDYERFVVLDGKRHSHLMDPRTGYPVEGMASVTVVTPRGIDSDVLSTAILVNRGEGLDRLLAEYPDTQVLIIAVAPDGQLVPRKVGDLWGELEELNPHGS